MNRNSSATALATLTMVDSLPPLDVIFGYSEVMKAVREKLTRVAKVNVPVLIQGESGTGKDIIARLVHRLSPWSLGPFVKVACPAIPGTLLESELFGYEKGAFTGAYSAKPGRVESAYRGTLFLDEISELEIGLQAKLLQLLQDNTFCRIGGQKDMRVEVRIVCATNRNLLVEIESGTFREDLFHRINGMSIRLPALKERPADIPVITGYLLEVYNRKFSTAAPPLSLPLLNRLQQCAWPGNFRQLEIVVRLYAILGSETELLDSLGMETAMAQTLNIPDDGVVNLKELTAEAVRQVEETVIRTVLARHNSNRKATAEALGMSYRTLLYKLRDMNIHSARRGQTVDPNDDREEQGEPGCDAEAD